MDTFGVGLIGTGIAGVVRGIQYLLLIRRVERSPLSETDLRDLKARSKRLAINRVALVDRVRQEEDPGFGRRLAAFCFSVAALGIIGGSVALYTAFS